MLLTSIDELAAVVGTAHRDATAAGQRRVLVGIAGPPGAGKPTVGAVLVERLGPSATLLPMDGFHLPQAELVRLGRRDRMGAPDTFDVHGFVATLEAVRAAGGRRDPGDPERPADTTGSIGNSGVTVLAPGFDREIEEAGPDAIAITPEFSTVVVEGNYLLLDSAGEGTARESTALDSTGGWERVAPLLDVTVFVDVEHDVRVERLVARHIAFGKAPDDARAWSLGPDEANARAIEASVARADHRLRLL